MTATGTARVIRRPLLPWIFAAAAGLVLAAVLSLAPLALSFLSSHTASGAPSTPRWAFPLKGIAAPNFTLSDQFGDKKSLSSFHGKAVVLAFVDARCTAVCPLTAEILQTARERLSPAQSRRIALVAVNANPLATGTRVAYQWSLQHHMLHRWTFLTGPPSRLRNVYTRYRIFDTVTPQGEVEHDAAVVMIDARGRERLYFNTAGSKQRPIVSSEVAAYVAGMKRVLSEG